MSGWQTVLDAQLDLYRFWRTPLGEVTGDTFGKSMVRVGQEVDDYVGRNPTVADHVEGLEAAKLATADPFYVDDDMMTLVEGAAGVFQPEPLHEHDLLTQHAFVILPRPMFLTDRHAKRLTFRALLWAPLSMYDKDDPGRIMHTGIHLSLYSHVDDMFEFEEVPEDVVEEDVRRFHAAGGSPYALLHVTPWVFGGEVPHAASKFGNELTWWQPIQAFLRLSLQTVADRYRQQPPRAARKRWEREMKARPNEDRYMTVIRLRRPRHHNDDKVSSVEWNQRWIVNGHWRNQWFPSLNLHRQVWISSYVKGPEDKPLLVRRGRAFEFVR